MKTDVVPLAESHFESLREALDSVAREKRFLALTQAPPLEEAVAYYRNMLENDHSLFVALRGGRVVGWCDVDPAFGQACQHVGVLGIGLVRQARHQGLGAALMQRTLAKAWAKGLTRIELTVRADNHNARALYERFGFQHEGLKRRAFRVDGVYFDSHAMALLNEGPAQTAVEAGPHRRDAPARRRVRSERAGPLPSAHPGARSA